MIAEFVQAWPLFRDAWLSGWLLAVVLPLLGVLVVARDQIFIGAAVSQASTLGIAVALRVGDAVGGAWRGSDALLSAAAVLSSVLAALLTAGGGRAGRASHEALTGWVFLVSASCAVLVVAHSPHGLEEVHRLVASSIIGATRADLWTFAALAAITVGVAAVAHRRLLLLAMDPPMAAAVGVPVRLWNAGIALWLGLVVGLSIRCAGVLYTFGLVVLPPLVARTLCREVRPMLIVAPLVALATAGAGFVLAHHGDYPPAQMTVALLCLLLALSAAGRRP